MRLAAYKKNGDEVKNYDRGAMFAQDLYLLVSIVTLQPDRNMCDLIVIEALHA